MLALESNQFSADRIIGNPPAKPEALLRLEVLLSQRVIDLGVASEIVTGDPGLKAHIIQLARECDEVQESFPRVPDCIVAIGVGGLRECLRRAHPSLAPVR